MVNKMNFEQGEVIDISGTKVVYIQMKRTKYTAVDLKDPTHVYSCKGGKSTGEFRPDLVEIHFAAQQKKDVASAMKQAESFKYKALAIGQGITMKDGRVKFVIKHKRTKLLSMDLSGDVWDSHYGAITGVLDETIADQEKKIRDTFVIQKKIY